MRAAISLAFVILSSQFAQAYSDVVVKIGATAEVFFDDYVGTPIVSKSYGPSDITNTNFRELDSWFKNNIKSNVVASCVNENPELGIILRYTVFENKTRMTLVHRDEFSIGKCKDYQRCTGRSCSGRGGGDQR